jgi:hypothetical protein
MEQSENLSSNALEIGNMQILMRLITLAAAIVIKAARSYEILTSKNQQVVLCV